MLILYHRVGNLQFFGGQIQWNTIESFGTIMHVAQESQHNVDERHTRHTFVQHTADADKVLWCFHLIFQRHHDANCLNCESRAIIIIIILSFQRCFRVIPP